MSVLDEVSKLNEQGRYDEALALITDAAATARRGSEVLQAIKLTTAEAHLLGFCGLRELAIARATWAISAANAPSNAEALSGRSAVWAVANTFLSWCNVASKGAQVPLLQIFPVLDQLDAFLRSAGYPAWSACTAAERAHLRAMLEEHEEATAHYRTAIALKLGCPDAPGVTLLSLRRNMAWALAEIDCYTEAIEQLELVMQTPDAPPIDLFAAELYLGHICIKQERWSAAAQWADRAVQRAEGMSAPQQASSWGLAVDAWLAVDRLDDARHAAAQILQIAERLDSDIELFNACLDNFNIAMHMGDPQTARVFLERMEHHLRRIERRAPSKWRTEELRQRRQQLDDAERR